MRFRSRTPRENRCSSSASIKSRRGFVPRRETHRCWDSAKAGKQFDRRGSIDTMVSGQGGYHLHTHGGRVPIPWLIGTAGGRCSLHQPYGTFDFTGPDGEIPAEQRRKRRCRWIFSSSRRRNRRRSWPNTRGSPATPEMPPLWSFGYQQSHRTLASEEEIVSEARTFREKKLPCDAMIYLGTGFCPSGWNTENGSFVWNSQVSSRPETSFG